MNFVKFIGLVSDIPVKAAEHADLLIDDFTMKLRFWICSVLLVSLLMSNGSAQPVLPNIETTLHGFPALLDLQGRKLGNGEFSQWLDANNLLHVIIDYDLGGGHHIEEKATFKQRPMLTQVEWFWSETQNTQVIRRFEVDFNSGKAVAEKREGNKVKRWSEDIKVEPGRTFAGFGFVLAIKTHLAQLKAREKVELNAVGFTPKPHVVTVELSYGGVNQMGMGGRSLKGDLFIIHPRLPAIVKAIVPVKDTHIWLTMPPAVSFLRWEGPLVEVGDPFIRVDLLSCGPSTPAMPVAPGSR